VFAVFTVIKTFGLGQTSFSCKFLSYFCLARMTLGGRSGLAVKRKYGHLTYSEDPNGVVGAMIRTMPFRHYSPLTSHSHSKLTQMQHNFLNMAKEVEDFSISCSGGSLTYWFTVRVGSGHLAPLQLRVFLRYLLMFPSFSRMRIHLYTWL